MGQFALMAQRTVFGILTFDRAPEQQADLLDDGDDARIRFAMLTREQLQHASDAIAHQNG